MKPRTTYGADTLTAAALFLQAGEISLGEISRRLNVPKPTLHRWKTDGVPSPFATGGTDTGTAEQLAGTVENVAEHSGAETIENAYAGTLNAVPSVPQVPERKAETEAKTGGFSMLDAVFYSTIGTACIGAFHLMGWWFLLPCVPYALISVDALRTAKDPEMSKIADRGRTVVIILELIASVSNHSLFNSIFWANIERLPVHIVREGNLILVGDTAPSYAAGFVAFAMFCGAFYAVDTTILKAKNRGVK